MRINCTYITVGPKTKITETKQTYINGKINCRAQNVRTLVTRQGVRVHVNVRECVHVCMHVCVLGH